MPVFYNKEQPLIDMLKENCNCLEVNGEKWYYCPFWFKEQGPHLLGVNFEKLPTELLDEVKRIRNGQSR